MFKKIVTFLAFGAVIFGMVWLFLYQQSHSHTSHEVHDFLTCEEAGGSILESYPRQCVYEEHTYTETLEEGKGELIGGQRDEHGCLGPAGYSYDDIVKACIRSWELDTTQKLAATVAVDHLGPAYGTTILAVHSGSCEGCYTIEVSQNPDEPVFTNVTLENFEVV
ncbi:MAG TPA: hypothetical protein ENN60_04075 [archaeon]|nr:hypothetical protein [archaeon]